MRFLNQIGLHDKNGLKDPTVKSSSLMHRLLLCVTLDVRGVQSPARGADHGLLMYYLWPVSTVK